MKKIILTIVALGSFVAIAGPHACPPPHHPCPASRAPHCPPPQHSCHDNWWIGPTIVGSALVGSALINAATQPKTVVVQQPVQTVVQQPVVILQPVVVKQPVQVWIEGRYVDVVQPNGTVVRTWQPGHYESR